MCKKKLQDFTFSVGSLQDELKLWVMDEDVGTDDKVRNIYIDKFFKVGMAVIKLSSLCINNGVRDWVHFINFYSTIVHN